MCLPLTLRRTCPRGQHPVTSGPERTVSSGRRRGGWLGAPGSCGRGAAPLTDPSLWCALAPEGCAAGAQGGVEPQIPAPAIEMESTSISTEIEKEE